MEVIVPTLEVLLIAEFGGAKLGWLKILKESARSWSLYRSFHMVFFCKTHVPILPGRTAEHVISGVPIGRVGGRPTRAVDCAAGATPQRVVTGRSDKRGWIEPLSAGLRGWVQVGSRYAVGATAYKADWAARGGVGDGEGLARLERSDTRDLPAANELVDEVARAAEERLTCANGERIRVAEDKDLWRDAGDVAARVIGICAGGVLQVFGSRDPGSIGIRR